jgi:hypothetical protein
MWLVVLMLGWDAPSLPAQATKPAQPTPRLEDLLSPPAAFSTAETPHLTLTAAASVEHIVPGQPLSLTIDVAPRRDIHIYAPGKHEYQVIALKLDAQPWLGRVKPIYPTAEIYEFKPLAERVEVYQQPFQLRYELAILSTAEARKLLEGKSSVTISGRLEYQACDDKVCYKPQTVPLSWTLSMKPKK